MQLITSPNESNLTGDGGDDDFIDSISMTIIPTAAVPPPQPTSTDEHDDQKDQTPVQALFTALSTCSNLHPDPVDNDNEDDDDDDGRSRLIAAGLAIPGSSTGGLPPVMPGSGGWITAENMHEFVDAEGRWIGGDGEGEGDDEEEGEREGNGEGEGLGPGAGTVRTRDDEGECGNGAKDGMNPWGEDTKWQRTS